MNFEACFRLLAERLKDEIIVTSAGNSSELWWDITHETERVFYLEASMSLASVFAAGIALGTERTVVAFNGDGAFCMNPGMLLVERQLALPNLKRLAQGLDDMIKAPGYAFAVLRVDPLGRHLPSPPLDGPEVKFRFGRYLERTGGRPVFDAPLHPK